MTEADLRRWIVAYTIAFNAQDSEGAAMLFTEDGTTSGARSASAWSGGTIRRKWDEHQDLDEIAEM